MPTVLRASAEYQVLCKEVATTFSTVMSSVGLSLTRVSKDMKGDVYDKGVDIHFTSCKRQIE